MSTRRAIAAVGEVAYAGLTQRVEGEDLIAHAGPLLFQQGSDQLTRIEADCGGNIEVFENVQPALAQLVFGDVRGRLT